MGRARSVSATFLGGWAAGHRPQGRRTGREDGKEWAKRKTTWIQTPSPSFGASTQLKQSESQINLLNAIIDVKFFAELDVGVEGARPAVCAQCGVGAGCVGSLRIHGHGKRSRDALGPWSAAPGSKAEITGLTLRRYRCIVCGHVMTILPPFLARYFRYTTAAIALAFWLWTSGGLSASEARRQVSPWSLRGLCEAHRWRSLGRWLDRLDDLFALPQELGESGRDLARRAAHLMSARAPPKFSSRLRAFVGAQLR